MMLMERVGWWMPEGLALVETLKSITVHAAPLVEPELGAAPTQPICAPSLAKLQILLM